MYRAYINGIKSCLYREILEHTIHDAVHLLLLPSLERTYAQAAV